jgi:hypothetical protein
MKNEMLRVSFVLASAALVACREPEPADDVVAPRDSAADRSVPSSDAQPPGTDATTGTDAQTSMDGGVMPSTVTVAQLQNITDPEHPMPGARISVMQPDLVALTGRTLIGSATASSCRFAVWVGTASGGDHSAIQVQELVERGAASNCFDAMLVRKIPDNVQPGTRVTAITNATYNEFCAGPSGAPAGACRNFEQSNIFLGGTATITVMGMGTVPTPTDVMVPQVGQTAMGMLGTRTLALEGTLIRVRNVRVNATMMSNEAGTSFTTVSIADPMDSTRSLDVLISNFPRTACARTFFSMQNGMSVGSITGLLVPDFGVWKLRLRNETDVEGLSCATGDAGAPADASTRD